MPQLLIIEKREDEELVAQGCNALSLEDFYYHNIVYLKEHEIGSCRS